MPHGCGIQAYKDVFTACLRQRLPVHVFDTQVSKDMKCYIYRCSRKPDMYIYLAEEDLFDNVPREIFNTLGIVEFAMELDIKPDTKLAREDATTVIGNLKEHGFHIQLPAKESVEEIISKIVSNHSK